MPARTATPPPAPRCSAEGHQVLGTDSPSSPVSGDFRYATGDAVVGGDMVCAAAPANARVAWERITSDPDRTDRQHPLKGSLGRRLVNRTDSEQWQYEVTVNRSGFADCSVYWV